jgi:hypothetical protein
MIATVIGGRIEPVVWTAQFESAATSYLVQEPLCTEEERSDPTSTFSTSK